jgi:hypothetical protein
MIFQHLYPRLQGADEDDHLSKETKDRFFSLPVGGTHVFGSG